MNATAAERETEPAELWTPELMDDFAELMAEKVLAGELDGWKVYGVPFPNTDRE